MCREKQPEDFFLADAGTASSSQATPAFGLAGSQSQGVFSQSTAGFSFGGASSQASSAAAGASTPLFGSAPASTAPSSIASQGGFSFSSSASLASSSASSASAFSGRGLQDLQPRSGLCVVDASGAAIPHCTI